MSEDNADKWYKAAQEIRDIVGQEGLDALAKALRRWLVDCPACAGMGTTYPGAKVGHWAGLMRWPEDLSGETCDLCQGSGEVEPETAAEWEAAQLAALGE